MKYLILLVGLFSATITFSQDAKAQGILDKLSKKIKDQKSFYIEFSAAIKSASGTTKTESGKGWVKGNKYSATYGENTIISNGLKTWTVIKKEKTVYISDANDKDNDAMNPKKIMTIWETGFKNKYDKEETLNGKKVHVISLFPKTPASANYHTITLYVGKDDGELKKAIMKGKDATVTTYTMSKFTSNPTVDDKKFIYDKTKFVGYKEVDS